MAQVSVTIAGRAFRMACEDGEEERLTGLAVQIDEKIAQMRAAFGEIGDNRLTVMAAISVADELTEAKRDIAALQERIGELEKAQNDARARSERWAQATAEAIDSLADRFEEMVASLNADGRRAARND